MNAYVKMAIVVGLMTVVGAVVVVKNGGALPCCPTAMPNKVPAAAAGSDTEMPTKTSSHLPRLVDLGASKCAPCKLMKPILDELREDYKDQFEVIFIDVWENPTESKKYGIEMIPTQIFYDAFGKELFRHEGFYSKEDILGKWKELDITFEKPDNPSESEM